MLLAGYILQHVQFLISVEDTKEILNALFIIYWIPFWDSLYAWLQMLSGLPSDICSIVIIYSLFLHI